MIAREVRAVCHLTTRRGLCRRDNAGSRLTVLAALLALAATMPFAQSIAQSSTTGSSPTANRWLPTLWLGSGIAAGSGSAHSAHLATNSGGMLMAAVELPVSRAGSSSVFALRLEGRWSRQSLATDIGSGLSGDVQTVGSALTLRVAPFASRSVWSRRIRPYALAGVGIARPSTRVSVFIDNADMPSARFTQTSSELAATALGGLGAQFRIGRSQLFAEARTEFARRDAGTQRTTFGALGIAFETGR